MPIKKWLEQKQPFIYASGKVKTQLNMFGNSNFGHWDLFDICDLLFVICYLLFASSSVTFCE